MKAVLAVVVLAASALAQGRSVRAMSACGIKDVNFSVKLDKTKHTLEQAKPGEARVYFINDDGPWGQYQGYVLKIALDGVWVGAYKKNSYFTLFLNPGKHHVCAIVQSDGFAEPLLAFMHFTAEQGKVYYFRTRFLNGTSTLYPSPPYVALDPLDSDEAKYLLSYYPLSISSINK